MTEQESPIMTTNTSTVRFAQPWLESASSYQSLLGVHQPHITEISGYQYSRMSQRQQKQYDAKRHAEWNASAAAKCDYAEHVVRCWLAGDFELTDATQDAQTAVWRYKAALAEQQREADKAAALKANRDISNVAVGDHIFCIMGNWYGTVTKINKNTIWFMPDNKPDYISDKGIKTSLRAIRWQSHNDATRTA
jgi:hypothetical protein